MRRWRGLRRLNSVVEIITVDSPKAGVLRRKARAVGRITPQIQQLIDAMIEVMHEANGVGLAAPQVGASKRVIVAEVSERLHVLIDPKILKREGEEIGTEAACPFPASSQMSRGPRG